MFDVNYNFKESLFCVELGCRLFEIFDSLFGINVDLGVLEGIDNLLNMEIDDFGVGLEFNLEFNDVVELVLIFLIKIVDNFLIWF